MLPPFWIPCLIILGVCLVVGLCELEGEPAGKSPRYRFAHEYAGRIIILGICCAWTKVLVWVLA